MQPLDPQPAALLPGIYHASRRKLLLLSVASGAFTILAIMVPTPEDMHGWVHGFGIAFSGGCAIGTGLMALRPPSLLLDPNGVTYTPGLWRKPRIVAWQDIAAFFAFSINGARFVAFNYVAGRSPDGWLAHLSRLLGADGTLGGLWPLHTAGMVTRLNAYRQRALNAPPPAAAAPHKHPAPPR